MDIGERIRALAAAGMVASEIAKQEGISRQRVYQVARSRGIVLPSYHDVARAPQPKLAIPRVITGGVVKRVTCTVGGTIAELLATADLMARGYQVYRPMVGNRGFDAIACKDGQMLTIEVRSAIRLPEGTLKYRKDEPPKASHYALVITGEPVTYVPDLPDGETP